jgi:hypothetical protein
MRPRANEFPWRLNLAVRAMSVGPDNPRRRTAEDARGLFTAGVGDRGPAEKLRAESKGPKAAPLNS